MERAVRALHVHSCAASSKRAISVHARYAILDGAAFHIKGRGLIRSRSAQVYRRAVSSGISKVFDRAALHGKG